jgi:hypothetical protein
MPCPACRGIYRGETLHERAAHCWRCAQEVYCNSRRRVACWIPLSAGGSRAAVVTILRFARAVGRTLHREPRVVK